VEEESPSKSSVYSHPDPSTGDFARNPVIALTQFPPDFDLWIVFEELVALTDQEILK
jgi:hypothetical protein